jgi:hypothetical protein
VDVAGALTFDDRGVVIGDAQRHLRAELFRQIVDERRVAIDRARGILFGDDGEHELRIFGLPLLRTSAGRGGRAEGRADHE